MKFSITYELKVSECEARKLLLEKLNQDEFVDEQVEREAIEKMSFENVLGNMVFCYLTDGDFMDVLQEINTHIE